MSDDESQDIVPDLSGPDGGLMQQILEAKTGDPSQFPSFWEMDEQDVDEPSEEEIQNNPKLRFLWAAENNEIDILTDMLESDPSWLNIKDVDGYSALHRASYSNHLNMISFLVSRGAHVNAVTNDGWTPLHSACRWNLHDAAERLLQCGASVNQGTNGKQTALHLASTDRHPRDLLLVLLNAPDIDISLVNSVGETARELCERNNPFAYLFEICDPHVNNLLP